MPRGQIFGTQDSCTFLTSLYPWRAPIQLRTTPSHSLFRSWVGLQYQCSEGSITSICMAALLTLHQTFLVCLHPYLPSKLECKQLRMMPLPYHFRYLDSRPCPCSKRFVASIYNTTTPTSPFHSQSISTFKSHVGSVSVFNSIPYLGGWVRCACLSAS
ncbi:hypothetical protein EDC04DRAFT_951974 [Pisolithus marmoratus]|nr:hypothetical protein EDC04DRAFT_951974 [Pisolithus marmoratus]